MKACHPVCDERLDIVVGNVVEPDPDAQLKRLAESQPDDRFHRRWHAVRTLVESEKSRVAGDDAIVRVEEHDRLCRAVHGLGKAASQDLLGGVLPEHLDRPCHGADLVAALGSRQVEVGLTAGQPDHHIGHAVERCGDQAERGVDGGHDHRQDQSELA